MNALFTVDRAVARHLVDAALTERSGVITATRGKLKRLFCLREGRIAYAASNVIEEQFSRFLDERGILDPGEIAGVSAAAEQGSVPFSRLVLDHGMIAATELEGLLEIHVRDLLFSTLDWVEEGEATFAAGTPDLENEVTVEIRGVEILLDYVRHHPPTTDGVRARVGPASCRPVVIGKNDELIELLDDDPAARFLVSRSDGSLQMSELISASPSSAPATWRTLYCLLLIGVVELESRIRAASKEHGATRSEVMARLEQANGADHYTVLQLNSTAEDAEVRDAYYFLARRYHPDRFRAGSMHDLLPQIEAYFTQVTEAYNTLSDPILRAEFNAQREAAAPRSRESQQDTVYLAKENYARAKVLIDKGRFTDAVVSLENAINLDAGVALYHLELGRLMASNPRLRRRAEECLVESTRLDPALVDGYIALGHLCAKAGRSSDAGRWFREVLRWEPGHLEATAQLKQLGEPLQA